MARGISNLLQIFDSCMYQLPLVYPCAGKKGGTGAFFIYTALYQLTKPVICSQSTCVTLSLPAWCRRWRQGQAGPCLRATAALCRSGSPSMNLPLEQVSSKRWSFCRIREKSCLYELSVSTSFLTLFGEVLEDYTKKNSLLWIAMNTLIQKNTAMILKY